jgi:prepilin-type N-terminal cleavage/methylation domain-containing protein
MTPKIHNRAFTLVELLVTIGIIGLLAALLLPVLSQSKVKSKRIQCLSNLTQIGRALYAYGNDHGGRLPWQILPSDQKVELGTGWHDFTMDPGAIFSLPPLKSEIGTIKVLLSPLDPERAAANESAEARWDSFDPSTRTTIPGDAISYLLAEGGDLGRPSTVLATTRNLSKCDLAEARWVGADENPIPRDAMAGLMKGKGNVVLGDGSSHLSNDSDLGPTGRFTREHQISSGGKTKGAASTVMLGCCGGYEIVPITKVFNTTNGNHHAFIIDKSGSMSRDNRLGMAQKALVDSLRQLGPRKKFYVYFFDSGTRPWINDTNGSKYALQWEVDAAETWIKGVTPGGMTNPLGAIKDTFNRIGPDTVWLLTDGRFNCPGGGPAVHKLISTLNVNQNVSVNTVGFHRRPENVDSILGDIAQDNNGTFYFSRSYPGGQPPPNQ